MTDYPQFDVIVVDPPWPRGKSGLRKIYPNQGRDVDYPTMPTPDIFNLLDEQIFPLAAEQHTVFMWAIDAMLTDGEAEMKARGYRRHARFVWDRGNGVAACFTIRYTHDYLVWFYKPKLTPVDYDMRGKYPTVFRERPRQHSRKPDYAYEMIEKLYPWADKIDVFSREPREGWWQWGNETDHFGA